jgi:hypothetical protein
VLGLYANEESYEKRRKLPYDAEHRPLKPRPPDVVATTTGQTVASPDLAAAIDRLVEKFAKERQ